MELRVAPGQDKALGPRGQSIVVEGGEENQLRPVIRQQVQVVPIQETEGLVPSHGDTGPGQGRYGGHRGRFQGRRPGQGQQALHVHGPFQQGRESVQLLAQIFDLPRGHQAQMSALDHQLRGLRHAAQGPDAQRLHLGLQGDVHAFAHAIEDYAPDAAVLPEPEKAGQGGEGRKALAPAVHHQHHGGVQGPGYGVGRGPVRGGPQAVVVAHDPLDEAKVRPGGVAAEEAFELVLVAEEEVRPALEGPDPLAPVLEGPQQAADHGGLAAARGRGGEQQAGAIHFPVLPGRRRGTPGSVRS